MMKQLPVIVWDVDDVLNHLTYEWFDEYRVGHDLKVGYDELVKNPPEQIMGISREEFLASLDDFRKRRFSSLEPNAEILAWFHANGARFDHIALTAAPLRSAPASAEWVITHFGRWIRGFHFVPSIRQDDDFVRHEHNKGDVLEKFKRVDIFIDDSEQNLATANHLKEITQVIFPAPWNRRRAEPTALALAELNVYLKQQG